MKRWLSAWVRNDRGATVLEFALVLPFLLVVVGIFAQMGIYYSTRQTLQETIRENVRMLAQASAADMKNVGKITNFVKDNITKDLAERGVSCRSVSVTNQGNGVFHFSVEASLPNLLLLDALNPGLDKVKVEQRVLCDFTPGS